MKILSKALVVAALGVATVFAAPAHSQVIVAGTTYNSGDKFNLVFNGVTDNKAVTGLNSQLLLTFNGWNSTGDYLFDFALTNTSTGQPLSEVTAFGFNTDPVNPLLSASSETSPFLKVASGSIANSHQVEFCLTGGPNCAGGKSTGPDSGETWSGSFILAFAGNSNPGPITLSNFHTRYQSVTLGNSSGASATGDLTQAISMKAISAVPEPDTWAMMLFGFGAIGAGMRRRRARDRQTLALA